ncbi:MAG TPA: ArsR family transcriptional regulator [Ktedonobacterales bacterium]|nr:ArsR family transcriptional regulator [Ktedonobacterales bacterium]
MHSRTARKPQRRTVSELWDERFFSTTRGQALLALRRGSRTVEELARALGLSRNAIRAHLTVLERDGLVQRIGHRRGTGKPSNLYALTTAAEQEFSQAYAPVLRQLLDVLREQLPPGALDDVLREVGRRMANEQGLTEADFAARLASALAMLDQLGGVATAEMRDNTVLIRSYSCPLVASVPAHPELCHMTETLLGQILGAPVRERCDHSDPPRCCFEVAPARAPRCPERHELRATRPAHQES